MKFSSPKLYSQSVPKKEYSFPLIFIIEKPKVLLPISNIKIILFLFDFYLISYPYSIAASVDSLINFIVSNPTILSASFLLSLSSFLK